MLVSLCSPFLPRLPATPLPLPSVASTSTPAQLSGTYNQIKYHRVCVFVLLSAHSHLLASYPRAVSAMLMGARAPYAPPPPPIPRPPRSDDGTYASMVSGSASSLSLSVDAYSLVSASGAPDPRPLKVEAPVVRPHVVHPPVAHPPVAHPPVVKPPVIKPPPVMEDRTAMLLMRKVEERMPRPEVVESAKVVVEEEDDDDMLPRVLRGVAR